MSNTYYDGLKCLRLHPVCLKTCLCYSEKKTLRFNKPKNNFQIINCGDLAKALGENDPNLHWLHLL